MRDPNAAAKAAKNKAMQAIQFPFAIEVLAPQGWVRMRIRYETRNTAEGWEPFVKAAWHTRQSRVVDIRRTKHQSKGTT
jgi:hypothetical protein